jgi:predicted nucleic acid-binding protein
MGAAGLSVAFLLDTDVMIDFLRGQQQAVDFLREIELPLRLSAITVAELYAGVRDGEEKVVLSRALNACKIHPLTHDIAVRGGLLRRDFGRSHGVGLADALIAATSQLHELKLVSLNARHYPMLNDVFVPYRKANL